MSQPLSRSEFASLVAAALHDGVSHLVLADWLDENLNRADVAAVLRASSSDPRKGKQLERTEVSDARSAPLDAEVTLYMARWQILAPHIYDEMVSIPVRQGYLIALCVSLKAVGLRRWVRWLEDRGEPSAVVQALWDRLGPANVSGEER